MKATLFIRSIRAKCDICGEYEDKLCDILYIEGGKPGLVCRSCLANMFKRLGFKPNVVEEEEGDG